MRIHVAIRTDALSVEAAMAFVDGARNGACALFVGRVRDHNLGRPVSGMTYDAFDALAENILRDICAEAIAAHGDDLSCFVEHFKGELPIGGLSVVIAVGSPHRDAAFAASRYIIEELKRRAPVWKEEHYIDGDRQWLAGQPVQPVQDQP